MWFLPLFGVLGTIASAVVLLVLIAAIVGIIFFLGRMLAGLVVNSILGLIAIFAVGVLFGISITINVITLIVVAIFGLPAVLIIILLKLIGIAIPGGPIL